MLTPGNFNIMFPENIMCRNKSIYFGLSIINCMIIQSHSRYYVLSLISFNSYYYPMRAGLLFTH